MFQFEMVSQGIFNNVMVTVTAIHAGFIDLATCLDSQALLYKVYESIDHAEIISITACVLVPGV